MTELMIGNGDMDMEIPMNEGEQMNGEITPQDVMDMTYMIMMMMVPYDDLMTELMIGNGDMDMEIPMNEGEQMNGEITPQDVMDMTYMIMMMMVPYDDLMTELMIGNGDIHMEISEEDKLAIAEWMEEMKQMVETAKYNALEVEIKALEMKIGNETAENGEYNDDDMERLVKLYRQQNDLMYDEKKNRRGEATRRTRRGRRREQRDDPEIS
jgi:hypothetical protein